jgi:hypothetical protein
VDGDESQLHDPAAVTTEVKPKYLHVRRLWGLLEKTNIPSLGRQLRISPFRSINHDPLMKTYVLHVCQLICADTRRDFLR